MLISFFLSLLHYLCIASSKKTQIASSRILSIIQPILSQMKVYLNDQNRLAIHKGND